MAERVERLIGVYDADGSVLGELSYLVSSTLGRASCALCHITHGRVRERSDWRACRDRLPVPFVTFHRDDRPARVREATRAELPVVLAEADGGALTVLAGRAQLEACAGDPEALVALLDSAIEASGLRWGD